LVLVLSHVCINPATYVDIHAMIEVVRLSKKNFWHDSTKLTAVIFKFQKNITLQFGQILSDSTKFGTGKCNQMDSTRSKLCLKSKLYLNSVCVGCHIKFLFLNHIFT